MLGSSMMFKLFNLLSEYNFLLPHQYVEILGLHVFCVMAYFSQAEIIGWLTATLFENLDVEISG